MTAGSNDWLDVDHVLVNPVGHGISRSSGEPIVFGDTPAGRYVAVVDAEIDDEIDDDTIYPVTAFDVPESTR